jgi:uncharacterized protein YlzI (FlbEa/FlbD family)
MYNCDTSGLNDSEIELIKDFPDFTITDYCNESDDINGKCRITGLHAHCVEIELRRAQ